MKKIIIAAVVVVIIGAGLLVFFKNKDGKVKYTTVPVQAGSLRSMVTATGTVNAVKTVSVGTQISGTIKELHVDYNSKVRKGQVIAEIDPASQQAQVDQAKANLLAARANAEKAKAMQEDAKRIRDRNQQLFAKNLIARADLDTSDANQASNLAQVNAALAQVAQTEAALRYAQTNLGYTKIISPVDGTVVSRSVDVGQTVAASFQTPTLFSIAQDLTKMQIDTSIDEADIGKMVKGQQVEFTVDAYPDSMFRGVVDEVRIAPITVSNVVTYDVVIKVDNSDMKLKPGMTANVSIIVAAKDGVLKIPNSALRFKPSDKEISAAKANGSQDKSSKETKPTASGTEARVSGSVQKSSRRPNGSGDTGAETPRSDVRRRDGQGGMGRRPIEGEGGSYRRAGEGRNGPEGASRSNVSNQPVPRKYPVWILENEKPKQKIITVGISDGSFTEVTSGDLKEGQTVITGSSTKTNNKNNNVNQPPRPPGGLFR